jgi:spore germination protein YaaH
METPSSPETPRKSRARERHERRKERGQGMALPSGFSARRQLTPAGGFKLPQIQIPQNRIVAYAVAGFIFIVAVIFILGRLKNSAPQLGANAIWIGTEWTYQSPDDAKVSTLVQKLVDHRIGTVYAWVSLLQPNNSWTDTGKLDQVKSFVKQFKRLYPKANLYGWLSIGSQGADGNDRLGDSTVQQMIADFSQRMIAEYGFDGIALNIVPVANNDENYLTLLRKVRATIGETGFMALAVPPDWTPANANIPMPSHIAPDTYWEEAFKQRVALLADQLIVTAYSSGLQTPADYSAWVAYQVKAFTVAIADLQTTTQILIGVPTYDAQPPTHDPAVENVQSAVNGIRAGLENAGDGAKFVKGIAIYAEWQASDDDWSKIKSLWTN